MDKKCFEKYPPLEGGSKFSISGWGYQHKFSRNIQQIAKKLRNNPTLQEQILWKYLRKSNLLNLKFRRQQPIGNYIVDFVCCEKKIIIELDGGQHNSDEKIIYDKTRNNFLLDKGYTVIRIWNNEIMNNIEGVIEHLINIINDPTRKSKISTLPQGEGIHKTNTIKIQCPAKINLTLKITGKRSDGFHNIESIMQTISLYDYLTISAIPSEELTINLSGTSNEIPYNEKNLVHKAAMLFIERTNLSPQNIDIFIEKNIPVAAGLAGGSTDAAGTLYGLNKIFKEPLNKKELHELCSQLGSDLNFCLEGGRQMTTGRGEILEKLPYEEFSLSLIKPKNLGISAKEAYTKFSQKEKTGRELFVNDLEWAVIDDYSELQAIKSKYPDSIMSGSGSTYYIIGKEFEKQEGFWLKNNIKSIPFGIKDLI